MKKPILLLVLLVLFTLIEKIAFSQSTSQIRYAQLIIETPTLTNSNASVDLTLMNLNNIYSIKIQYGVSSDIDQYYEQIFTLNSSTNVTNNIVTDQGHHTYINLGAYTVSEDNVITISLIDASNNVIESKQIK